MNIIFLDIDGVLNNTLTYKFHNSYIDENCLELFLDTINEIPDCKIVVSSSWRSYKKEKFINYINITKSYSLFRIFPFLHDDYCTPKINNVIRGKEIEEWLNNHKNTDIKYICIDDDGDFLPEQPLLQTNRQVGFSLEDSKILRCFFNGSNETDKSQMLRQIEHEEKLLLKRKLFIQNF